MTQSDVVSYLINIHVELMETYDIYQNILYSIDKTHTLLAKPIECVQRDIPFETLKHN